MHVQLQKDVMSMQKQPCCKKKGAALFKLASVNEVKSNVVAKEWLSW